MTLKETEPEFLCLPVRNLGTVHTEKQMNIPLAMYAKPTDSPLEQTYGFNLHQPAGLHL
jgi:hypothetical protein